MTLGTVADLSPAARYQSRNVLLVEEDTAGETGNQRGRGWDSRGECFVDSVLSFCHHVSVLLLSTKIGGEGRGGEGEREDLQGLYTDSIPTRRCTAAETLDEYFALDARLLEPGCGVWQREDEDLWQRRGVARRVVSHIQKGWMR